MFAIYTIATYFTADDPAALLRSSASRDEVLEEAAKVIEALESPYDHHRQTGEDCAYYDAIDAAEIAIRALKHPAQGGEG